MEDYGSIAPLPPYKDPKVAHFSCDDNGFYYDKMRREDPARLRTLLFPDEVKGKRAVTHA